MSDDYSQYNVGDAFLYTYPLDSGESRTIYMIVRTDEYKAYLIDIETGNRWDNSGIALNDHAEVISCPFAGDDESFTKIPPEHKKAIVSTYIKLQSGNIDPDWMEDVRYFIAQGKRVDAIKVYRSNTGKGLKESKDFVDSLR